MKFTTTIAQSYSRSLSLCITDAVLSSCYGVGKNELVFTFKKNSDTHSLVCKWIANEFFLLYFPRDHSPSQGYFPAFKNLISKKVIAVNTHADNRSFEICFEENLTLLVKLYNGLSNFILFEAHATSEVFRQHIKNDYNLQLTDFIHLDNINNQEIDSVLLKQITAQQLDEIKQLNFEQQQKSYLTQINSEIKKCEKQIEKITNALESLTEIPTAEDKANLLMAHLHDMQKGMTEVTLNDFYQHQSIHITLKKNLSPQENAAHYYSKYKVQRKQHQKLLEDLNTLKNKLADLMKEKSLAAETKDLAELPQPIVKNKHSDNGKELPFRKFEKDGFTILVGKNAASNDLLTMKHAHKNDLWLHTHGVSGSHVVIKHIAGKEFTKQVIEFAASIAAYYSKLKGSQLVPVSYTLKKHVRKRKGAAPGEVIIEREKVAMVKPMLEN